MERRKRPEAACVTDLRESRLNAYAQMPNDISSHYNDEGENEENYYGRFAYELIQNADDAVGKTDDPESPHKARFELATGSNPHLIVANTGPPVDDEDTRALTTIGDTTKRDADRKATIGHKGRGFSSVLEITEQPYVFSTDVSFMFDRSQSRSCIEDLIADVADWEMADIAGIPLMRLPFAPDQQPARVAELLDGEYETVFYFPLRNDAVEDVRNSLSELDRQTVLFLQNLKELDVVIDDTTTTWEIGRHGSQLDPLSSSVDRVKILRHGEDTTKTGYLRFTRDEIKIGEHTDGISNNTWGDVSRTRVSMAVRAEHREDGMHLLPVEDDPRVHVFLPTEERSPVPLLVNGAFDANLSRTAINMTDRELDYNRFLLREAANIVGADIATIARGTATEATEFLSCLDFTTWANPDSRDRNTVRDELIRALQDEFVDTRCVPIGAGDGESPKGYIPPTRTLLPSVLEGAREEVIDFVDHWGGQQVNIERNGAPIRGYFPQAQLLTSDNEDIPQILQTLGATTFPFKHLPYLLPELPDDWFTLRDYPPAPQQTSTDPVIELIAAVWTHLRDDAQKEFATAAQEEPIVPVGTPSENGQVSRVPAAETELYLPREDGHLKSAIPEIRFVTECIYRPRNRLGSQALPPAIQHRQSVIKQVWRPDSFQFEELVRTTVPRLINEPNSEDEELAVDLPVLALLQDLGSETADPDDPLLLRDRYDAQPQYRLCKLPVPTKDHGWCPAYRVYFGDEWLPDDRTRSVEPLFDEAGIDAPFLISPETLEERMRSEGVEVNESLDKTAWADFLQWIGVSPHLRLKPFFGPDEQRRYSDTVAKGGVDRPSNETSVLGDLDRNHWKAYREHLETALDEMSTGRQAHDSIYRVNSFEYWETIHREATANTAVGQALIDHLIAWWDPVFSEHRDAVLATHKVSGFTGRNSSSQSSDELRRVGTNLWLWQLQTTSWCPSSRGPASPSKVWDPPERQSNPFAIGEHSLLPILERSLDPRVHEAQPLLEELDIRQHLSTETFDPEDARTVCEGLADVCRSGSVSVAESLRDIQPIYRQVQDLSPPVDESLPEDSTWQTATETLADCQVLCRVGESFKFYEAQDAYFARSPSVRADYPFDDEPIFVLEEQRSARFGEYFGLHDFTQAVTEDGEPITARNGDTLSVRDHLDACAPYILCRLEAERPSQRLIDQDRNRMESFLDSLTIVEKIEVTYMLNSINGDETRETTTTTEFYLETRKDGAVEHRYPYVVHRDLDREQWQLLARSLCAYLDVTQFEGIDALLSASTNEERRQYLQYANAPASKDAIQRKQAQLDENQAEQKRDGEFGAPDRVNEQPTHEDSEAREKEEGESTEEDSNDSSPTQSTQQQLTPTLYDSSELRIKGSPIHVEPSNQTTTDEASDPDPEIGDLLDEQSDDTPLEQTAPTNQRRDQSQYDVEDLGVALAQAWEITRLRKEYPDCTNPEAYVFRTDERHLIEKARDQNAEDAIDVLELEAGIPRHFPGFDLLTVNPETGQPDRLIELKAATCRRNKPTISWNEWTTARNEWVQNRESPLYYLYVVGHLSKTTNSDPYIRTIPNPFRLLDAQIEREVDVSRSVQVDVNAFSEEDVRALMSDESVLEIPVEAQAGD